MLSIALLQCPLAYLQGNIEVSEVLNVESSAQEAGIRPVELIQLVMADPELQKVCLLYRQNTDLRLFSQT